MTKKKKAVIGISVVVAVILAIVIGGYFIIRAIFFRPISIEYPFAGDGSSHTVSFDSQGGSAVENQTVRDGNPLRTPESPTRDGYTFIGWFNSADENAELWIFTKDRVHSDFALYAHWTVTENAVYTESLTYERNANGFTVTGAGQDSNIIIPATYNGLPVTVIGGSAFSYGKHNADILSVTIPDSVTAIERNAFSNRSELVTVNVSENSALTAIGNNAFSGCAALESIYIPAGVNDIGDGAFNNCGSLNRISVATANSVYSGEGNNLIEKSTHILIRGTNNSVIPASVTAIAPSAFRRAGGITELIIPLNVTEIGNYFISGSTITTVRYEGTEENWNAVTKGRMWNSGNKEVTVIFKESIDK